MSWRPSALLSLALAALAASPAAQVPRELPPDLTVLSAQMVEQTNAFRRRHGLAPVVADTRLEGAAQRFAEFMARTDRYGHDADGRRPADRAAAEGYDYCAVAENIAYVFSSLGFTGEELASRLMAGWVQSPRHRQNMLLESVTGVGFGVAHSAVSTRYYAVQIFAQPRSAATRFEITNRGDSDVRYEVEGEPFTLAVRATRTHLRCSQVTLRLLGPDATAGETAVRVRDGVRYVVSGGSTEPFSLRLN